MAIFTIEYEWFNPMNPKCRACKFFDDDKWESCTSETTKVRSKYRQHNSKACAAFELDMEALEARRETCDD